MKHVTIFKKGTSQIIDQTADILPSKIYITKNKSTPVLTGKHSCYIFINRATEDASMDFLKGKSFPLVNNCILRTPTGNQFRLRGVISGLIVEMIGINEVFQINPLFEKFGRLKYIDGCTDTLIISPTISGLPCLSALYFPQYAIQTQHTHPSYRIGMVVSGSGICRTPNGTYKMDEGDVIIVHRDGIHAFETDGEQMTLVSFHPDSEFGPEDKNHPMINKTIVEGKPANQIEKILTK